jgi:hypothetical protein
MQISSSMFSASAPLRLATSGATPLDARTLPGTYERAEDIIDRYARATVGRQSSTDGFERQIQRQQKLIDGINAALARLPASAAKDAAWKLAEAHDHIADAQAQIDEIEARIDADPLRDQTLSFAAKMMGLSVEEVHKLYEKRLEAHQPPPPPAQPAEPTASTGGEWGWDPSGLRAEIKVNGVVVGRIYNSGTVEVADEYGPLTFALGFGGPGEGTIQGPDLADQRIAKLKAAFGDAKVEVIKSATAMTRAEWMAWRTFGSIDFSA